MTNGLDLSEFYDTFFDEADELLTEMEQSLLALDAADPDMDQLHAIFRAAHSIKGGAGMFGCFEPLAQTTHLLENLLDAIRSQKMVLRPDMITLFLETKDVLATLVATYRAAQTPDAQVIQEICARLQTLAQAPTVLHTPVPVSETVPVTPEMPGTAETAAVLQVAETAEMLAVPPTPVTDKAMTEPEQVSAKNKVAGKNSSTIRIGVEKVDQVINLVGELVITQAMLDQTASMLDPVVHERLIHGIEQLTRNAHDLQEAVMSIRMIPIDYVFSRFPRLVRESASKLGKRIRLVTQGQATELDKSLMERMVDPLTHLVRNSLDHGIESPEVRLAAGKEAEGQLTLSAQHSGGQIVIEVSDDGAGLNREKILRKALAMGMPVSENTPDEELWQLIFASGFSTASQITDISGRGVGMDVVRRNIQSLGGQVHLYSRPGQGTTTRIALPLTLAILDSISVRVGKAIFILPLSHVIESLQPAQGQVHAISTTQTVLHVRGEYLPLCALHQVFSVADAQTDASQSIAVILQAGETRFAVLVDHLVGQQQVVVKNLEANYRKVPNISAATILGDGSVALIVDVFALMRKATSC